MPKPYLIEYTLHAVVMADDTADAHRVAADKCRDVLYDTGSSDVETFVHGEVKQAADLAGAWDLQCIPYNGDGNTRLEALITPEK